MNEVTVRHSLVVFDMDGTLYPNDKRLMENFRHAAVSLLQEHYGWSEGEAEAKLEDARNELALTLGAKVDQGIRRVTTTLTLMTAFDRIGLTDLERRVDELCRIEDWLSHDERARAAVEAVSRTRRICLYTMNNDALTNRILAAIGMDDLFPNGHRYTSSTMMSLPRPRRETVRMLKPWPAGLEYVMEAEGAEPAETLMVGDSMSSDIVPARKLGAQTYRITTIDDLYELPSALS